MKYKSKLFLLFILIIFCTIGIILDINRIKTCINQEKTKNLADFYQNNEKSSWVRSWGGPTNEWAITMAIDSQDNIYVTGILWESHSICLLKYDSSGHLLWSRIWEENDYYWGSSIALDSSDNIYLAGKIYSDFFLIKFDPLGNLLWERFWGEEFSVQECPGIAIDSLDHICVVGRIKYSSSNSNVDIFLIKFNSTGGIISNQFWDFIERDKIDGICLDSSNDIYLIINSQLIKYNSTYHLKWSYNLNNFGDRLTITIDNNDDIIIANESSNLIKFNNSGNQLWILNLNQWYNYTYMDEIPQCRRILTDSSKNIYLLCEKLAVEYDCCWDPDTPPLCLFFDSFIEKFNTSGDFLWERQCSGCGRYKFSDIALDSGENIYICGYDASCCVSDDDTILIKNPQPFNGTCINSYGSNNSLISTILIITAFISLLFIGIYFILKRKPKNLKNNL